MSHPSVPTNSIPLGSPALAQPPATPVPPGDGHDPVPGQAALGGQQAAHDIIERTGVGAPQAEGQHSVITPATTATVQTGSIADRMRLRAERAQMKVERFTVPTTDEDDDYRVLIDVTVIKDSKKLAKVSQEDSRYIEASTIAVYTQIGDQEPVHVEGGWRGIGALHKLPREWHPHRAVMAECESNPFLVGRLAAKILEWSSGIAIDAEEAAGN